MAVSWPSLRLLQWPSWSVQRFFGLPPPFLKKKVELFQLKLMLCCPSLEKEKARTFFFSYWPKQKRLVSWSIDWLDRSTKRFIEVWDQPKTKAEQLAAARLDVIYLTPLSYSLKGRRKECSAHLSYGSLTPPSASSILKGSVFFLFLLVNSVLKRRHYWTKEMPGRSIALSRGCRTCLNHKCIRHRGWPRSYQIWIPKFVSLFFTLKWKKRVTKGILSFLYSRLINERRLIEMAFVPVNLYPILQV